MPDAIELLQSDHRAVERLFAELAREQKPPSALVNAIVKELSIHDAIEKEHLYPIVRDRLPRGNEAAEQCFDAHDSIGLTLAEIDRRPVDDPALGGLLDMLIATVRTHVAEEEEEIFPVLRIKMAPEELDELGDTLESAKAKAPTRPHPHAPNSGVGARLAAAAAAPLDKLRDAIHRR